LSKYEPLQIWLRQQSRSMIPMTFHEIEKIIGSPLPASKASRAWWSNNPSNNVMTREWLAAGYETEQVDIEGERLVFRRAELPRVAAKSQPSKQAFGFNERRQQRFENEGDAMTGHEAEVARGMKLLDELYAKVGGLVTIAPGVDLTAPWDEDEWPDPKRRLDGCESEEK
jgi:hypothetical protein